jgi:PhnB protein
MSLMTLDPCINLSFDGRCEAAFKFYEHCLNGKISFMLTWADSPMAKDAPPEWGSKIVHATLVVGNIRLQGSDPAPGSYESPRGFVIILNPCEDDAERLLRSWQKEGSLACRFRKHSGLTVLACSRIGLESPGRSGCEKSE